jgi:galactokinase
VHLATGHATLAETALLAARVFGPAELTTLGEAAALAGISEQRALAELVANPLTGRAATPVREFRLGQRTRHVFEEAARVEAFAAVCREAEAAARRERGESDLADDDDDDDDVDDDSRDDDETLARLGALMDASHASCAELFDCSCPALDALVADARAAGALGARLTGAGWGGCAVLLVRRGTEDAVMARLRESHFAPRGLQDPVMFATAPGEGTRWWRE